LTGRSSRNCESSWPESTFKKVKGLLGLAHRAGKLVSGTTATRIKLEKGLAFLIIVAEDASQEIKDYFRYKSREMGVPLFFVQSKLELGLAVGKSERAVIGILDRRFAQAIWERLREMDHQDQDHGGEMNGEIKGL
jgi:ribosomal protein L7Ae-like RNA K-turn-binding protein